MAMNNDTTIPKTKEEILFPIHMHCPEELDVVYDHDRILVAMDEYAKQQAIEFKSFVSHYMNGDLTEDEPNKEATDEWLWEEFIKYMNDSN